MKRKKRKKEKRNEIVTSKSRKGIKLMAAKRKATMKTEAD